MKLKYYGTAAAEGVPGLFCSCDICNHARSHGGRNIRTRSQATVDDTLLIDFPADTYLHVLRDGLDLTTKQHLIITHSHSDHLYPMDFIMRKNGFVAKYAVDKPLNVYGMPATRSAMAKAIELANEDSNSWLKFHDITPFVPFYAGEYKITALPANHDSNATPVIYVIEKDGCAMLYGNDTGYFFEEVWEYLAGSNIRFNLVSLDSTMGFKESRNGHMGVLCVREVIARLKEIGVADDSTIFVAHHFTHNARGTYEDFKKYYEAIGILTSFDSMEIKF